MDASKQDTDNVRRPSVPAAMLGALCLWACAAAVLAVSDSYSDWYFPVAVASAVLCVVCAGAAAVFRRVRMLGICLTFACLGIFAASLYSWNFWNTYMQLDAGIGAEEAEYEFRIESDSSVSQYGSSCTASVGTVSAGRISVLMYVEGEPMLLHGQIVRACASLQALQPPYLEMYRTRGVVAKASVKDFQEIPGNPLMDAIIWVRRRAIEVLGECGAESGGVLQALVCGYRNTVEQNGDYDAFKVCGLAHIVAVSGAHLAIVAALLGVVLAWMKVPRLVSIFMASSLVIAYLVFAGIPISALRAAAMVVLALFAFTAKRRSFPLNALGLCIAALIVISPESALSVSLYLSAGSTLGILLFASLISSWFGDVPKAADSFLVQPLSLTASSNIAALPLSMAMFSQLPLIAPLSNIVAAPLFSAACIAGLIAAIAGVAIPVAAPVAVFAASVAASPLVFAVHMFASIPYASIAVDLPVVPMIAVTCAMMAALYVLWPHLTLKRLGCISAAAAVLCASLVFIRLPAGDRICMLDVGQGDSFLLESSGMSALVDTGNSDSKLRDAIAEHGVRHLDAVFISHSDEDHCACLDSLSDYVQIDCVYIASDMLKCTCSKCTALRKVAFDATGRDAVGLSVGDRLDMGNFCIDVIWPEKFEDEGGNADSLCLYVQDDCDSDGIADMRALFCGDAEEDQISKMVQSGRIGDIDILKVGHHGSRVSVSPELLEVLRPECALISVGANNRYGHPTQDALSALEGAGSTVFRSDTDGCVDISVSKDRLEVRTEK